MSNCIHWAVYPLDFTDVKVLRRIQYNIQNFFSDRLSVAYLVARECIVADLNARKLSLTEKGLDALYYYRDLNDDEMAEYF